MNNIEKIKSEIESCTAKGLDIIILLNEKPNKTKVKTLDFYSEYQNWYSQALRIVEKLAPDRYHEFKSYYEIDTKRKSFGYGSFVIQDFLKGVVPSQIIDFDSIKQVSQCIFNQYTILNSLLSRVDSVLSDIQTALYVELQDIEIETASNLIKVNLRSSGVIAGVVLESYLQRIVANHKIATKKNPTLSDLNEILKNSQIYDTIIWRKISYLADIRNLCAHKKDVEPQKEQVIELINGVKWVTKNVF